MSSLTVIAHKELLDFRRNRLFVALLGLLILIVLLSVGVAALDFRTKMGDYTSYVSSLAATGSTVVPSAPQLFSLQLLRGSLEYLELLGALFAIILGYRLIAKDKGSGTTPLIFTRPVRAFSVSGGKLFALAIIWAIFVIVTFAAITATLLLVGTASLSPQDYVRLTIVALATWLYLMFWSSLAMGLVATISRLSVGLILSLVIWLIFVLIIPQIGDTMDPDNQVPGGLFKSLSVSKVDEQAVTAHFVSFETARDQIEITSIAKHFERVSFAFLGVKDMYNQQPISSVWAALLPNSLTLLAGFLAATTFSLLATVKRNLLRKES